MDVQKYKILYKEGEAEISEKEIKIYCTYCSSTDRRRSTGIHREDKKSNTGMQGITALCIRWDQNREYTRCSDDGEPSGTAGRPMLDVILGEDIYNVAAVVTRYFGGILLGTGGLVRAYSRSLQEGLAASTVIEKPTEFLWK